LERIAVRLHRLIELAIEIPMGLKEKVVREQKDGEMMRLLYIVFIFGSRIIHSVFGKVCQLFAREGGASIYLNNCQHQAHTSLQRGLTLLGTNNTEHYCDKQNNGRTRWRVLHLFSRQVAKRRNKMPSFIMIMEYTHCVKLRTLDLTVHRKSEKIASSALLIYFSCLFLYNFIISMLFPYHFTAYRLLH
jgi:hypothetical protein